MLELLNATQKRRLEIIKTLNFTHNKPISVDYLSKLTGASKRTVEQDLDKIQRLYPCITITPVIDLNGDEFLRINFECGTSIKSVYQAIIKEKLVFNIVDILIHNENLSVDELADKLFSSHSTLYRAINDFNKVAEDSYHVQIETSPCRIVGEESQVRFFFTHFLYERYTFTDWPFENIERETIETLLDHCLNKLPIGFDIDYSRYHYIILFMAVNISRTNLGYRVKGEQYNKNAVHVFLDTIGQKSNLTEEDFKNTLAYYEEHLQFPFDEERFFQLFFNFFDLDFALNRDDYNLILKNKPHIAEAMTFLENNLTSIAVRADIPLPNLDDVLFSLYNETILGNYGTTANFILFDEKRVFLECFENMASGPILEIPSVLQEFLTLIDKPYDDILLRHLYFTLVTSWQDFIVAFRSKFRKKRVLLLSSFGPVHGKMYTQRLNDSLSEVADIDYYQEAKVDLDKIRDGNYDVILTNVNLPPIDGVNTLYVEACPTEANQKLILDTLVDL